MMRLIWIRGVVGLLAVALVAPASADEVKKFRGEASVNVIEIPVSVIDKETGQAIAGLTVSDFRVFEGGEALDITNFYEVGEPGSKAITRSNAPAADRAAHTRQLVYFFDLYLMKKSDRDRAVKAVRQAYGQGVGPDEEVSIVSFDGTLRTHLDRSRDRRRIGRALGEVAGIRTRGVDQTVAFTEALSGQQPSGERDSNFYERRHRNREYMFELERRVVRVRDALSATMARFARAEGRRAVIAFTPGQPATSWSPSVAGVDFFYGDVAYPAQDLWNKVALDAADLGFTLFIADSSGIDVGGPGDASQEFAGDEVQGFGEQGIAGGVNTSGGEGPEGGAGGGGDAKAETENLGNWLGRARKNMLVSAADLTGGKAFFFSDMQAALGGVADQLGHWYSIAYAAPHGGDGRTYDIEVDLPGYPNYQLIYRKRYVDRTASAREAEGMRSAMLFGGDANPLGILVDIGDSDSRFRLGAAGAKRVQVPFVVKIPIGRLDMVPRGDVFWGKVLITLFGKDQTGNQSPISSHVQPITVPTDQFHKAATTGFFSYKVTVEIEGGKQTVFVGVKDQISGKTSIVTKEF
ncbi:MAG: VWA domain-containing protein [Acidobacteriota bacterium]